VAINLLEPPYLLPDPIRLYVEGGHPHDRQFLGLWRLPLPASSTDATAP